LQIQRLSRDSPRIREDAPHPIWTTPLVTFKPALRWAVPCHQQDASIVNELSMMQSQRSLKNAVNLSLQALHRFYEADGGRLHEAGRVGADCAR